MSSHTTLRAASPSILYLTHAYYNRGGVEEHVKTLARLLPSDWRVHIATPVTINAREQQYQLLARNIPIKLHSGERIPWPCAPLHDASAAHFLREAIVTTNPYLIHIQHFHNWPLGTLQFVTALGIPVVMSFHDYFAATPHFTLQGQDNSEDIYSPAYAERTFGSDISRYLRERRSFIVEQLSRIQTRIVPSVFAQQLMEKLLPQKYTHIPHGVDLTFAPPEGPKSISGGPIRFYYIGSLLPQKGTAHLIESFLKACEKRDGSHKEFELHIYGGGPEQRRIPAHPKIFFHGRYRPNELPHILSRCDVGIVPSLFRETFSYTLSEYHACGIPVIAADIGALTERITDGDNGLLYKAGSADALCEKILLCARRDAMHTWNVSRPCDEATMTQKYIHLYQELLGI